MKVVLVTPGCFPSYGGPAKSIAAFQRALNARVIAWVDTTARPNEPMTVPVDAAVRSTAIPGLRTLLYPRTQDAAAAANLLHASDLVSCHLFWRWYCHWTHTEATRTAVPYWLVPHGSLDPYVFQNNRWLKNAFLATIGHSFFRSASALVCSTRREYDKARQHARGSDSYVLPWPLDPDDFRHKDATRRAYTRQVLGIPENAFCLVYIGRLHGMKRPIETIAALADSKTPNCHLIIVGNEYGVTTKDCLDMAQRVGIRRRVHVVGAQFGSAKRDFLDAADAFISLSHRENFNYAATEALASGLPVILSPGNDLCYDLSAVECGWLLPDIALAGEAITEAALTPRNVLEQMGARGRDWAQQHLQFETFRIQLHTYASRCIADSRN